MNSLQKFLETGDEKEILHLLQTQPATALALENEGLNVLTAAIMGNQPDEQKKMKTVKMMAKLLKSDDFCRFFEQKMFTLHPDRMEELFRAGIEITPEIEKVNSAYYDLYDMVFPYLSIGFVVELLEIAIAKGLILKPADLERLKTHARKPNPSRTCYAGREIDLAFRQFEK